MKKMKMMKMMKKKKKKKKQKKNKGILQPCPSTHQKLGTPG